MSIVVEGVSDQLVTVDLYALQPPGASPGRATVRITVPRGAVTRTWTDETEAAWVEARVVADRADAHVGVEVRISAPTAYPTTVYARWGANQVTRRGPSDRPVEIELDGLPSAAGTGLISEAFGGPERDPAWRAKDTG